MYLHSFVIFGPPNQAATREKILEKANYSVAGLVYPLIVVEQVVILGNLGKPPAEIGGMKVTLSLSLSLFMLFSLSLSQ